MTNSDRFYKSASTFQAERKKVMDKYEKTMADLKPMAGSQYYAEQSKKAEANKKESLDSLIANYGESLSCCLRDMKKANSKRSLTAPSEEQLRLITVLKMKGTLSQEEVMAAANSFSDNDVCLSVLHEIAQKNNIHANIFANSKNLPMTTVENILNATESNMRDFLQYDSTRASRAAAEHNKRLYGTAFAEEELPKRKLFETKEECFSELFGNNSKAFFEAID